jgi:DNA repair protein RadC
VCIKGKNVKQLSEQIIKKFGKNFLDIKVEDLLSISGIGRPRLYSLLLPFSLVKRF